jgi:hypothetical protein
MQKVAAGAKSSSGLPAFSTNGFAENDSDHDWFGKDSFSPITQLYPSRFRKRKPYSNDDINSFHQFTNLSLSGYCTDQPPSDLPLSLSSHSLITNVCPIVGVKGTKAEEMPKEGWRQLRLAIL